LVDNDFEMFHQFWYLTFVAHLVLGPATLLRGGVSWDTQPQFSPDGYDIVFYLFKNWQIHFPTQVIGGSVTSSNLLENASAWSVVISCLTRVVRVFNSFSPLRAALMFNLKPSEKHFAPHQWVSHWTINELLVEKSTRSNIATRISTSSNV
jgi:hypothetical protein